MVAVTEEQKSTLSGFESPRSLSFQLQVSEFSAPSPPGFSAPSLQLLCSGEPTGDKDAQGLAMCLGDIFAPDGGGDWGAKVDPL